MNGRIFYLRKMLLDKLKYQWTIKEMADYVELSAPHLHKLFKIETGTSPISYLRELRLERARELLETTFHQINKIGPEVGIPNESHFTRDFKKKYGVTPTVYRKRHWEKIEAEDLDGQKQ